MSPDPTLLSDAIKRNDAARVRELLRQATEADRRACAKALRPLLRGPELALPEPVMVQSTGDLVRFVLARMTGHAHEHAEPSAEERERDEWNRIRKGAAFLAAALGVAGGVSVALRAADDHPLYLERPSAGDVDAIAGVLADRHPEWLGDFINRRLSADFELGLRAWPLARRLVRLGVIDRPDIPGYATKFPQAVAAKRADGSGWLWSVTPYDGLLADPGRLDPSLAARAIVTGVTGGAFKLNRVANGLRHASPAPLAGYRIIETVFAAASSLIPAKPANLHLLFELAARIGTATGIPELPAAITGLASQKGTSRLMTEARRLANNPSGAAPARGHVITQALTALTAHAEP